jgi:hypothetical protein
VVFLHCYGVPFAWILLTTKRRELLADCLEILVGAGFFALAYLELHTKEE